MKLVQSVPKTPEKILIIGAYGLIGYGITHHLMEDGHVVVGLGRNKNTAMRVLPDIRWIVQDVTTLKDPVAWDPILKDISVVINCSGALQDGPKDDLEILHNHSISALAAACNTADIRLIQISAIGASLDASTHFLSSKARGDAAIRKSGVKFHIFRPGLVLAPHAYGGTAMLRMLAAFPIIQPIAMSTAQIQTVSLTDIAYAVSGAISGKIPNAYEGNLVDPTIHPLRDVVSSVRQWLGFKPSRKEINIPQPLVTVLSMVSDGLAYLGWRSPLRSTAFKVLTDGVIAEPSDITPFGLRPTASLSQTLASMPARVEDRLFARMALLMPLIIATLSFFWLASGLIGLIRANEAALVLENVGWSHGFALSSVIFWALIDITIAALFTVRKYAPIACWLAIFVSVFYLAASTLTVPNLWLDPLGPLIKIIPSILLALVARITLETR
jgi:uncharacterized protein YbjT (DUF2867 family)